MERVLACVSSYSLVKITLLHGSMSCEKQSPLPQGMEEKSHIVTYTIHTIFKLCVRTIRNARNSSSSTHITANCLLPCWLQLILIFGQSHLPQLCLSSSPPLKNNSESSSALIHLNLTFLHHSLLPFPPCHQLSFLYPESPKTSSSSALNLSPGWFTNYSPPKTPILIHLIFLEN